ncbi:hypothetical protein FLAPJACK_236 [Bacillus phage Flapjack]|uniref:Uncharacterized protein n=1 Tax=Bacillus phage Flapjack TaxID=1983465 RepID=A0A1X9SGB6_9CAUD|nr:hypothetical protein FLAPJACK_236 [Bacillus phage Flapjack]
MLKYIKEYIKLFWNIHILGGGITQAELRSLHQLALAANPEYRAKKGGVWERAIHQSHAGYGHRDYWLPKEDRLPTDKLLERETYIDGKLYKVQRNLQRQQGYKMVTEYIK